MNVSQFVDDYVFQAMLRFLGQFQVEADPSRIHKTGTPAGFHFLDGPGVYFHSDNVLPFFDQPGYPLLQLTPIPFGHCLFTSDPVTTHPDVKVNSAVAVEVHFRHGVVVKDVKFVLPSLVIMDLTGNVFMNDRVSHGFEFQPMFFDPRKFGHDKQPDYAILQPYWGGNPDPAHRRKNPQMKVPDVLFNHVHHNVLYNYMIVGQFLFLNLYSPFPVAHFYRTELFPLSSYICVSLCC